MSLFSILAAPIAKIFVKGLDIIDELVEDKDLANKLKSTLELKFMELSHNEIVTIIQGQTKIILAETQGDSWLQRNWRPLLMLTNIIIILNNFVLAPYILLFFPGKAMILELPGWMGALLTTGVGGYIGARTIEKIKGVTKNILPRKG